jgi:hypothetical protein
MQKRACLWAQLMGGPVAIKTQRDWRASAGRAPLNVTFAEIRIATLVETNAAPRADYVLIVLSILLDGIEIESTGH